MSPVSRATHTALHRLRRLPRLRPGRRRTRAEDTANAQAERHTVLVLDLSLRIAERLLAAGEGAADVETAMLTVLRAYGRTDCEPQVTFTMISVSRQVGQHTAPVTITRTVRRRKPDYQRLVALYQLISQITRRPPDTDQARRDLDAIDAQRPPYPAWIHAFAPGVLAASASLLVSGRSDARAWITFALAFLAAVAGSRLAAALATLSLADFYLNAAAAVPAAAAGVGLALTGAGLGGSAVVTGSLFALFPGRTLVGAIEDGLTGFYLTAAARLLEVLFLVAGIIIGVLAVLPAGVRLGAAFAPEGGFDHSLSSPVQIPAAAVLAACLAIMVRTPRAILPATAVGGALAWTAFDLLAGTWDINPIAATGVAAFSAALFGQCACLLRHLPPLPYITGALGPLLPGSLLYTGVLGLGQGKIIDGVADLSKAAATALALAVGVGIASETARLARTHLAVTRR